ncbi:MAG TPA: M1 family aminopeptidase, partial [Candidatus Lustribacter sp.]|nr:M1 family aminopeptidase [Candidatus Lustribacter sp.]
EFNAGAMENPACVTIRDQYLFRGAATGDEIQTRDNTIAHEMAHMWFGDLVTMRWWDDLWLNESFAEYLSHRALVEATRHTDAWVGSTIIRKAWGYAAERAPSTHPVAGGLALDAQSALQDFDGIAYAKGAAVLRQLIAYVGDAAFVQGLRHHVQAHAFGNADMGDLLASMERSSRLDLASWRAAWLTTAGRDEISAERRGGQLVLRRVTPARHPADRPHTLDTAGYSRGREVFRVPATIHSEWTQLDVVPPAAVVVPNASDLTWAAVRLDDDTVAALPDELALIPDVQVRATIWVALVDSVAQGLVDPAVFFAVLAAAWPHETHAAIMHRVALVAAKRFLPHFTAPAMREPTRHLLSVAGEATLELAEPGSSTALGAARLVAQVSADRERLARWLAGERLPRGLEHDSDFRWLVLGNLAYRGWVATAEIEAARAGDSTLQGALNALCCRASLPDAGSKAWAWEQLTSEEAGRSNYELNHLAEGFWRADDDSVVRPYVARYFEEIPLLAGWVGEDALARVVLLAFPKVIED